MQSTSALSLSSTSAISEVEACAAVRRFLARSTPASLVEEGAPASVSVGRAAAAKDCARISAAAVSARYLPPAPHNLNPHLGLSTHATAQISDDVYAQLTRLAEEMERYTGASPRAPPPAVATTARAVSRQAAGAIGDDLTDARRGRQVLADAAVEASAGDVGRSAKKRARTNALPKADGSELNGAAARGQDAAGEREADADAERSARKAARKAAKRAALASPGAVEEEACAAGVAGAGVEAVADAEKSARKAARKAARLAASPAAAAAVVEADAGVEADAEKEARKAARRAAKAAAEEEATRRRKGER